MGVDGLMIDRQMFSRLAGLSKFDFSESTQAEFTEDLNAIVDFIGKVSEFGGEYDDTADGNHVSYSKLRDDVEITTATPEQLLANTKSANNCYIIPRVID